MGSEETDAERKQRLRQEALEGTVEDGDVTWFDSPLSQHRRRLRLEREPAEQDDAERRNPD